VDWDALPLHPGARAVARDANDLFDIAACFGGEFELLFTFDPAQRDRLPRDVPFTVIGNATPPDSGLALRGHPSVKAITCRGYQHLTGRRAG